MKIFNSTMKLLVKKQLILISVLIVCFSLTGCTSFMLWTMGMRLPKPLNEKQIYKYAKKYDVPLTDCYDLDTNYVYSLKNIDTTRYKESRKSHIQPLQALYYYNTGYLQSFHINCYAQGWPDLKWDRDGILATFPPLQQAPIDSLLPLDSLIRYIKPLSKTVKFDVKDYDYIVVVFWNRWWVKNSERLIHFIQGNCKLTTNQKVKIIYVNNDNMFAYIVKKSGGFGIGRKGAH
ncbi:MAG: hypothetical protein WCR42_14380 [bacterium]